MRHRFELDGIMTRDQIPEIRKFVEQMHRKLLGNNTDLVARIAMATHELFENAVKFSVDGNARLCIDISRDAEPVCIRITTVNRATDKNLQDLRKLASALAQAEDVMLFYVELMRSSDPDVQGGLGLGRVAAEAEMKLKLDVEADRVMISAELVENAAV